MENKKIKCYEFLEYKLIKYGVSHDQARILYYLSKFFGSGAAETITDREGTVYSLIYYSKIVNDNRILQIGESRAKQLINDLEQKGFIKKYKPENSRGQKTHYTKLYINLSLNKLYYTDEELEKENATQKVLEIPEVGLRKNQTAKIFYKKDVFKITVGPYINHKFLKQFQIGYIEELIKNEIKKSLTTVSFELWFENMNISVCPFGIKFKYNNLQTDSNFPEFILKLHAKTLVNAVLKVESDLRIANLKKDFDFSVINFQNIINN